MSSGLQTQLAHQPSGSTAAIAVIIRDDKLLLGLREYEGAPTVWTAPGGSVDVSETFEEAARRETKEETGIDDLEFINHIGEVNAEDRDPLHIFHCESDQEPNLVEPEKFNKWWWFALDEFASGQPENYISEPSRKLVVDYFRKNGKI